MHFRRKPRVQRPDGPGGCIRVSGGRRVLQTGAGNPRYAACTSKGGTVLEVLNAAAIRQWSAVCVQSLNAHRDDINRINVYPVPDSDTGTNLLNTMRDGLEALLRAPADARRSAGSALGVLARGALAGAAGNSGVIMSQILRGMAESA